MGSAGKPAALSTAQGRKKQQIQNRVQAALAELAAEGKALSFYQVSQRAGVARSTLYRNPQLRALVEQARYAAGYGEAAAIPRWPSGPPSRYVYAVCRLEGAP